MEIRSPTNRDLQLMDSAVDSDWTINLPVGVQGHTIGLAAIGVIPVNAVINAQPGQFIDPLGGNPVTQHVDIFYQERWNLVYHEVSSSWILQPNQISEELSFFDIEAQSVPLAPAQIPLVYRSGDQSLVSVSGGDLLFNYTTGTRLTLISADIEVELELTGNNQATSVRFGFVQQSGTGQFESYPDSATLAFSRSHGPVPYKVSPKAYYSAVAGDLIRLVGYVIDEDGTPTEEILDGSVEVRLTQEVLTPPPVEVYQTTYMLDSGNYQIVPGSVGTIDRTALWDTAIALIGATGQNEYRINSPIQPTANGSLVNQVEVSIQDLGLPDEILTWDGTGFVSSSWTNINSALGGISGQQKTTRVIAVG